MATLQQFQNAMSRFGEQLSPDVWRVDVPGRGPGRNQKVFVFRELIPPDLDVIKIVSSVAPIALVDPGAVLRAHGLLNVAAFGHNPDYDAEGNPSDGVLTLSTSMPLGGMDLTEPSWFHLYVYLVGQAADKLDQQVSPLEFDAF